MHCTNFGNIILPLNYFYFNSHYYFLYVCTFLCSDYRSLCFRKYLLVQKQQFNHSKLVYESVQERVLNSRNLCEAGWTQMRKTIWICPLVGKNLRSRKLKSPISSNFCEILGYKACCVDIHDQYGGHRKSAK